MRRILARAKRRSRAFSKVSPSVSLSPFVVELVCAFYFAKGSSSSESLLASRYTTPVMPTFSLSLWRGNVRNTRERGERILASGAFSVRLEKAKTLPVLPGTLFLRASFAFFTLCFVFSLFALLHKGLRMFEKNAFNTTLSLHLLRLQKHRPKDAERNRNWVQKSEN